MTKREKEKEKKNKSHRVVSPIIIITMSISVLVVTDGSFPCSEEEEEVTEVLSLPEVVEVPPPHLRWWRYLHPKNKPSRGCRILPGSK